MFFACIRRCDDINNNPTTLQFKAAYRKLLSRVKIKVPLTANLTAIDETFILPATNHVDECSSGEDIDIFDDKLKEIAEQYYVSKASLFDHRNQLIRLILRQYFLIRLHHEANTISEFKTCIRTKLNKLTLFKNQTSLKNTLSDGNIRKTNTILAQICDPLNDETKQEGRDEISDTDNKKVDCKMEILEKRLNSLEKTLSRDMRMIMRLLQQSLQSSKESLNLESMSKNFADGTVYDFISVNKSKPNEFIEKGAKRVIANKNHKSSLFKYNIIAKQNSRQNLSSR
uniref:Transposable element P transposase-like RNase H C-terminal domain-containing protein n=1 Tax=Trichogramma kaykai TaxID=54128 RepID=A0ABD2XEE0_9HYME